ncbi:hypothetical protein [Massilia niastensis]|uniref:hypothetical protein n=1 Tax=Massilia niastensis TaxID=544911 RepID=UPI000374CC48|nr:hypothetical protein [Massilia niastensis]
MENKAMWAVQACLLAAAAFVAAAPASAGDRSVCDLVSCSASGVSSAAVSEALKGQASTQAASRPASREAGKSAQVARDPWVQHLGGAAGKEDYSCLLSVGVGGEFAKNGFFATRALGRTLVLGGKESERR